MPINVMRNSKELIQNEDNPWKYIDFLLVQRNYFLATWTAYNKVCPPYHKEIGFFTKGFIKLSSQFIFSREQSAFVTSNFASQTYLTGEFLCHLFAI
jgi:hypothetical protein